MDDNYGNKKEDLKINDQAGTADTNSKKQEYSSPKVIEYGKLVNLTLGVSGGTDDTGGQGLFVP